MILSTHVSAKPWPFWQVFCPIYSVILTRRRNLIRSCFTQTALLMPDVRQ